MSAYRERSLSVFEAEPPRAPGQRRMLCRCGCGRWFYVGRGRGRPLEYASQRCALKARSERRRRAQCARHGHRLVVAGVPGLMEFECCARCGAVPYARGNA